MIERAKSGYILIDQIVNSRKKLIGYQKLHFLIFLFLNNSDSIWISVHPFRWAYCCPSLHTMQQRTIPGKNAQIFVEKVRKEKIYILFDAESMHNISHSFGTNQINIPFLYLAYLVIRDKQGRILHPVANHW